MTLQIRDERARDLAEQLAKKRQVTMTTAVIQALEAELRRESEKESLSDRIARIADDLARRAGPNGRPVSKEEIDDLWGHS